MPKRLKPAQRQKLASEVVDFIVDRTRSGKNKNNRSFPGYEKAYTESKEFKRRGKSSRNVNLTLTREMLDSLDLISHKSGSLLIGYPRGNSELNGKVEGNRKGTYGQSTPIRGKKRDFLGITQKDLKGLINKVEDESVD